MKKKTSSRSAQPAIEDVPMTVSLSSGSSVDFGPIAARMEAGDMTPREVSEARNLVGASLSRMRFMMATLAAKRAKAVTEFRASYRSLAETERAWEATYDGQAEIVLTHQIKALEGVFSALETNWFLLQGERKSNY